MEIQGEPEAIDAVIDAIAAGWYVEITNMDVEIVPVIEERGFRTE
jgi:hypothetical protein